MPGVMQRLGALCLMGEVSSTDAERLTEMLRDPRMKLRDFEGVVRTVAYAERSAELQRTIRAYTTSMTGRVLSHTPMFQTLPRVTGASPSLGAGYSGRAAHTIVIDEVTQIK
ncbi:hypothetical protein DBR23_11220 [Acidovorax sp. HMWF018]|nr:hypothetical protein DBR23_11220 [Acidovorax sp. HMWF018]